ncbi:MAG: hypothetical protein VXZ72_05475 [Chlamydiota bacterium]|nr:hypothetical protein [Chlamydiota bacterium]
MSTGKFRSKKFAAYLVGEFTWKFLIFYVILEYKNAIDHYAFMVLVAMIITSGFLQIGYILGQAALDKYTQLAETSVTQTPNPSKPFDKVREEIKKEKER